MSKTTVNKEEIAKFTKMADEWWDKEGKFKPLHKFNPSRIKFVKNKIIDYFKLDTADSQPLKGLKIADIGCGGGLLCEPFTKFGADVTGIDAGEKNIKIAALHAKKSNLKVNYENIDIEILSKRKQKFDVVLAMEIIEHVDNVELFFDNLSKCLKKNGLLFVATLNRTPASYIKAIIGAEYVLRWLPIGTHEWKKFIKPSEIFSMATNSNLEFIESKGFDYNIITDKWKVTNNLDVNYIMVFNRPS